MYNVAQTGTRHRRRQRLAGGGAADPDRREDRSLLHAIRHETRAVPVAQDMDPIMTIIIRRVERAREAPFTVKNEPM